MPAHAIHNLKWEKGDYWKYEVTVFTAGKEERYIKEMKVKGKENITLYGKTYFAYKVEMKTPNGTLLGFWRVGDLAEIGIYDHNHNFSIVCDPPMEIYRYLKAGKKWIQNITWIENIGGKITNVSFTVYYECMGKEKVKTKAEEYQCYKIKSYSNQSNGYGIYYFSSSVKNKVLSISYIDGKISEREELMNTSFKHGRQAPSFTFLSTIFILFLLLKKNKRCLPVSD